MGTEKLKFKLELYATMWDQPPHAEILVGDKSFSKGAITGTAEKPDVIEFEHELEENKEYQLTIHRTNKGRYQTKINSEGDRTHDQLLHIKRIEIDEIDLGALIYEGVYTPTYPEPWATQQRESGVELQESFKNVDIIGHNGRWSFKFESPFYIWLLENLY